MGIFHPQKSIRTEIEKSSTYNCLLLLLQAQEVILMGPWTGNAQKTGKTRRKWVFFILRIQSALKLKKVVHTTIFGKLYKVLLNSDCLIKQCRAANQCLPRKNKVRIF